MTCGQLIGFTCLEEMVKSGVACLKRHLKNALACSSLCSRLPRLAHDRSLSPSDVPGLLRTTLFRPNKRASKK